MRNTVRESTPQRTQAVNPEHIIASAGDVAARLKAVSERDQNLVAEFRAKIFRGETQLQQRQAEEAREREAVERKFQAVLDQSRAADRARLAGTRLIKSATSPAQLKRGVRLVQEAVSEGMSARLSVAAQLNHRGVNGRGGGGERADDAAIAEKASRRVLAMVWNPDAKSVSVIEQYRFNRDAADGYDRRPAVLPIDKLKQAQYIEVDAGHNFTAHYRPLADSINRIDAQQSFDREKEQGSLFGTSGLKRLTATFFELVPEAEWRKVPQNVKDTDGAVLKARDFIDFSREVQ